MRLVDKQLQIQAESAMKTINGFETLERYAIREVVTAARSGACVEDACIRFARAAFDHRGVQPTANPKPRSHPENGIGETVRS